ncbi:nucleotidyltransferase family protein [Elusimicrobiota bacterium]
MNKRLLFRNILIFDQLEEIIISCNSAGIQVCLLKGCALIQCGIFRMWEREMEDIDILIKERDMAKFNRLMRGMGYSSVCSGEMGYYKSGKNAVLDVHTGVLYADDAQLEVMQDNMKKTAGMNVLSYEDQVIYTVYHGLIHDAGYSKKWMNDTKRLLEAAHIRWRDLADKFAVYGLSELFLIASSYIGIAGGFIPHNTLKKHYIELVLKLPKFEEKGHFLIPFTIKRIKDRISYFIRFFFPDLSFIKRRYRFRPAWILLYLRPLILFYRTLTNIFRVVNDS